MKAAKEVFAFKEVAVGAWRRSYAGQTQLQSDPLLFAQNWTDKPQSISLSWAWMPS
jgi:hypothetical protein